MEVDSAGGSLYDVPDVPDDFSAGWESFGDTDSLGTVGNLIGEDASRQRTRTAAELDEYVVHLLDEQ
jgi:hypothetical protein